jgi:hypothetical protein
MLTRKEQGLCTYPNCPREPLEDNNECRYHRTASTDRKRYWWHFRRHCRRPVQLKLFELEVR